jgi:hypothetical protein
MIQSSITKHVFDFGKRNTDITDWQVLSFPRRRESSNSLKLQNIDSWIPAFAGMTEKGNAKVSNIFGLELIWCLVIGNW